MCLSAIAVVVSCLVAGLVTGGQLDRQLTQRSLVLDRSEPLANSTQDLYAALSAADAAAASAFLSGGIETPEMRSRYREALASATSAMADAIAGATDTDTRNTVAEMSAQLNAYTGLVEAARANNRQGFPIGSAYLREASSLMQTALLPKAEKFYTASLATADRSQHAVGSTPAASVALLLVALVVILVVSVVLRRRTNRIFNVGLVVAATILLVAIGWVLVVTQLAANDIDQGRAEGTARFQQLAKARILAQQARTDETLLLIARGDVTEGEKAFNSRIGDLNNTLGVADPGVAEGIEQWNSSHRKQIDAYKGGDYRAAVIHAIGADPGGSAAQFAAVESRLRDGIEQSRATIRAGVDEAGDKLALSPVGTLSLTILAAAAALAGLWPRLKEFL